MPRKPSCRSRPIRTFVIGSHAFPACPPGAPRRRPPPRPDPARRSWRGGEGAPSSSQATAGGNAALALRERPLPTDTVEKLDFLPRSQFLRQQAGFKKKALRISAERLTFRCAAAVANWRWQRVALSALQDLRFSDVPHIPGFSTSGNGRTGFFKPVHVKSLPSHAVRALLVARKKLVGQRVTLENQIRGLAGAFGVRLPRGLSSGFAEKAMAAGCGIPGLDGAMRGLLAARDAILKAILAINTDMKSLERSSSACRRLMTIP